MTTIIKVTDVMLIGSLRNLYEQGEITLEQYACSLRRYTNRKEQKWDMN